MYIYILLYLPAKIRFCISAYSHITNPFSPIDGETDTLNPGLHKFGHRKEALIFPHTAAEQRPPPPKHPPNAHKRNREGSGPQE